MGIDEAEGNSIGANTKLAQGQFHSKEKYCTDYPKVQDLMSDCHEPEFRGLQQTIRSPVLKALQHLIESQYRRLRMNVESIHQHARFSHSNKMLSVLSGSFRLNILLFLQNFNCSWNQMACHVKPDELKTTWVLLAFCGV